MTITSSNLTMATLRPKGAPDETTSASDSDNLSVQFNPATLRISLTNQFGEADAHSHARKTTAKLDVELIFDTTDTGQSVYQYLNKLTAMTRATPPSGGSGSGGSGSDANSENFAVPIIEFRWRSKLFEGVVESLTQTIEYWSHDGVPLRATVQLALKETDAVTVSASARARRTSGGVSINNQADNVVAIEAPSGARTATDVATQGGNPRAGRTVAAINGMESMRTGVGASASAFATTGSGGASAGVSAQAGAFAGAGASASAGASIGVSASVNLQAAASFKASGGVKASAGASLGFGLGASAGASAGAGLGASAGIGMAAGASIGAGAGIGGSIGAGIGGGIGLSAGASVGVSAGASLSIGGSASAGVSASNGAFAGLGSSKMIGGKTGIDPARLLPPVPPMTVGASATFDPTGRLSSGGGTVVAQSYSTSSVTIF